MSNWLRGVLGATLVGGLAFGPATARADDRYDKKERIEENADRAKDRVEKRSDAAKERIERQSEAAKERVDRGTDNVKRNDVVDPWITVKVKAKYFDDELVRAHKIDVDTTHNGIVTLSGQVLSERARARAIELARDTEGVRKVIDKLKIRLDR